MDQPLHDLRIHIPSARQDAGTRTVIGIVVLLLHVGLVAAIIAGLKTGFIIVPKELQTEVFKPKDEAKPPPPPPPDLVKPPPPTVPPPTINIQSEAPTPTITVAPAAPVAPPAPPPPVAAPVIVPAKAVGRTHDCQSTYPDLSRRLNETGTVLLRYDVGADGAIQNVVVTKSSGSQRLDAAALSCVSSKWRDTPATQNGSPVASPGHEVSVTYKMT